jgi:hypothetical protein
VCWTERWFVEAEAGHRGLQVNIELKAGVAVSVGGRLSVI